MKLYPLFADLQGRRVLVVGGGPVAERKVKSLLSSGAQVIVGSPTLTGTLQNHAQQREIIHLNGCFEPHWLDAMWLVIAATEDRDLNQRIAALATERRLLINVVDDPVLSTFQVPSIVDRAPLTIAISSAGHAPVLARRVRERIESLFDHSIGSLVSLAARYRPSIRKARPDLRQRREFYDWLLDGPVSAALRQQQPKQAEHLLEAALSQPLKSPQGRVVLVGAGPGDPGLLTLNALRALNEADIILHDRLVSPAILDLARRDAVQIEVGKRPGENHDHTQARIHALMLSHASQGQFVARVKGGDAFVFGRGGEELEFLREHNVPYEVVPGVTAALACAAYAGVPLTHRDYAQSVRLATAHCREDTLPDELASMLSENQTLAFYMAVGQLEWLEQTLIRHGKPGDTPFAIIENGTRPEQRVLHGNLLGMAISAREHRIVSPAMVLIGKVAALAPKLEWFGTSAAARVADETDLLHEPESRSEADSFIACA